GGWLAPEEAAALLGSYGIALVEQRVVGSAPEAATAADELGGPVALKAVVPGLIHKARAGAVMLDLRDPTAVRQAARELQSRFERVDGFVVQRMAAPGVELLAGMLADERLGPVVACAAGGEGVQEIADVQVRLAPLARREAEEMVHALRTFALLE